MYFTVEYVSRKTEGPGAGLENTDIQCSCRNPD